MKALTSIPILLLLCMSAGTAQTAAKKNQLGSRAVKNAHAKASARKTFTVSGKVQQTFPYCGGAAPSPERMSEIANAIPFGGQKFFIRKGSVNTTSAPVAASFITDENGNFSVTLPPGTYSIIVPEQLNTIRAEDYTSQYVTADHGCMEEWWSKPYYLLVIKNKNITGLSFVFHHRCFVSSDIPCLQYEGPMPP